MCGEPLASAGAPREERKIVSVLFCDLVGSTARAERLDPEDVRTLLSRYHELVKAELERFGGTVEKFIGDAVMALFGAPVAHEDDPERAVRAALVVREKLGDDLAIRIGITTGEALITLGAHPDRGEAMAAGDVVNTAARLQSVAESGGILVDDTTYRATSRAIDYEAHAPVQAKGKAEAVGAWQAVQARSRFGVDVRQIGRTELVGRRSELDALTRALERTKQARAPQLVTLVGVPGIGKSRLVWELFRYVERGSELVRWRQGRSLPYGEGVSFWALGEMVKAEAGILETDSQADAAAKLHEAVAARELDEADWLERHLRPLVGLEAESELGGDRRSEAFAAWRRYLEGLAQHRPTVLVFEDLHWADDGLLDFVDHLVDWASGVPLLVVATARPELLARRPGWGGGKPNAATVSLAPLSDDETTRLIHALLDRSVMPAEVQASLLERAEGNPLYAEEFVRLVGERRGAVALPESVQGIIAARLDALRVEEKDVLQDAAVVGKVFWLGSIEQAGGPTRWATEELLHSLERKEFLRREQRSSVAGEIEYAFRHALVREVAYDQIPRARRVEKHRAAARWIESLGRPEDHAEMLAHHYLSAIELARAAGISLGELPEAVTALRDAGDRAYALNAFPAAARFYEAAVGLLPSDDAERPLLMLRRGAALRFAGDPSALATLEAARDVLLAQDARGAAGEADALIAEIHWFNGEGEKCMEHVRRAGTLVRHEPSSPAKARVLSQLARYEALAGEAASALRHGTAALAMAEELGLVEVQAHALNNIGMARRFSGDARWREDIERSIELARSVDSPEAGRGLNNLGASLYDEGDIGASRDAFGAAAEFGERYGLTTQARYARTVLLAWPFFEGRWDEFLEQAGDLLATERHSNVGTRRMMRAFIRLARGDEAAALEDLHQAIDELRRSRDPQALVPGLGDAVVLLGELGDVGQARELARELEPALQQELVVNRTHSLIGAAWAPDEVGLRPAVLRALGRAPIAIPWRNACELLAQRRWVQAADAFAALDRRFDEARARLHAAEELVAQGRRAEADAQLEPAIAFFGRAGASRYMRRAESLLAQSA
jgi:class 3 adenylate cyclase/tetratricopeptide (TPR) repeat protein